MCDALKPFCGDEVGRYELDRIHHTGEHAYATDGRCAVRCRSVVPADADETIASLMKDAFAPLDASRCTTPFPQHTGEVERKEDCECTLRMDSEGDMTWEEPNPECDICGGKGYVEKPAEMRIGRKRIAGRYIVLINTHLTNTRYWSDGAEVRRDGDKQNWCLHFVADGGIEGVVAGIVG